MKSLTSGEIAKHCDVNLRTVIRWLDSGKLKGYKLPGRGNNRVRVEDFVAFLQAHNMPIPEEFKVQSHKVLIVDDELEIAKSIQRVVKRMSLDTEIATDGFQAGAILGTLQPSLMTLDLSMPGLDGFEVLQYTRSNPEFANTKILVISALDDSKLQKAIDLGANAAMSKPFSNDALRNKISELLAL